MGDQDAIKQAASCPWIGYGLSVDPSYAADVFAVLEQETAVTQHADGSVLADITKGVSPGQGLATLRDINRIIRQTLRPGRKSEEAILTRTAEEILASGEIQGGCHDVAIAFAGIARFCGFPVIMVDSASISFLEATDSDIHRGHAYIKVFVREGADDNGRWLLVNPTLGEAYETETAPGMCLPGKDVPHNEEIKHDEQGPYIEGGRIEIYEVQNYWDVGFGIDPVKQCLDVFKVQYDREQDCSEVKFRPIPL